MGSLRSSPYSIYAPRRRRKFSAYEAAYPVAMDRLGPGQIFCSQVDFAHISHAQ
jgi:hypothetical protein